MKIKFLQTGKLTDNFLKPGITDFLKRTNRYIQTELIETPDVKFTAKTTPEKVKDKEAEWQVKKIEPADYLVLLDEKGKEFTSVDFASYLQHHFLYSGKNICFIIGGAYGFSDKIYTIANDKIALSKLTFNHQLVRLLFMEQLYRAVSIINGLPYHNQ